MSLHPRKMQQHREACCSLDQRADGRTVQSENQIALPVTPDGPVFGFGWTFTDHDFGRDKRLAFSSGARAWRSQRSPCSKAGGQLASEPAARLNEQGLINRFVTDPHLRVVRKVQWQSTSDLLGAPGARPATTLAWPRFPAFPFDLRPRYFPAIPELISPDSLS